MPKIILLGDSTCAQKSEEVRPETGWGECFEKFVKPKVGVENRAINGLSSREAIAKGIFKAVLDSAEEEDIVIIQFGHNDSKEDSRYSYPWTSYVTNLVYMAEKLKAKGAYSVFITSIARRRFEGGMVVDTHGDYPAAMKAAANQAECPCIDMTIPTMLLLQSFGDEESKRLFMNFGKNLYPNYPDGDNDDTHLRPEGAKIIARMIYDEIKKIEDIPDYLI